jgi:hypothetical protein
VGKTSARGAYVGEWWIDWRLELYVGITGTAQSVQWQDHSWARDGGERKEHMREPN